MRFGLTQNVGGIAIFAAGIFVAAHVDDSTPAGEFAAMLAGGFAFLGPIFFVAFVSQVEQNAERERLMIERYEREGTTPAEKIKKALGGTGDSKN